MSEELHMVTHQLKCLPEFFDAVASGRKPFDVRRNDRGFQTGDRLLLRKFDPTGGFNGPSYVDRDGDLCCLDDAVSVTVDVTYVLSGWGVEHGFVVMGIRLATDMPEDDR